MRTSFVLLALVAASATATAAAQTPVTGSVLVAAPDLSDRNFSRSVLVIVHHDDEGSIGLFVNRPTNLSAASVFPDVGPFARYGHTIYLGGPVAPAQLLLLLRAPAPGPVGSPPVLEDIYVSADPSVLDNLDATQMDAAHVRIYAGHAGWGPGQLESEISRGDWLVLPGTGELVFTDEPLELWQSVGRASSDVVARLSGAD